MPTNDLRVIVEIVLLAELVFVLTLSLKICYRGKPSKPNGIARLDGQGHDDVPSVGKMGIRVRAPNIRNSSDQAA